MILLKNFYKGTFDVGTGKGIKIKDLLEKIKFPLKKIQYKKGFNQEVDISIANLSNYKKKLQKFKFKKVENFFKINDKFKNYFSENLNKLYPNETNTFIWGRQEKNSKDLITKKNQNLLYFIDDNKKKIRKSIYGKKIISLEQLIKISKKIKIDKILIAIPSLRENEVFDIYNKIFPITKNISSLPNKEYFKKKNVNFDDLIDLNVEEILNRKIFQINFKKLNRYQNKTILVTGGAGSLEVKFVNN